MMTVGIVVPYYNASKFVDYALDSLVAQTRLPDAVVLVDDGSKPKESQKAKEYHCPLYGVEYLAHPENWGPSAARNTGILRLLEKLSPDIFICLDADDMLAPGYIEMMVNALDEHPEALVAYSDVQMVGFEQRVMKAPLYDPAVLMVRPFIVSGSAFRAQAWKDVYASNGYGWDPTSDRWGWEDYLFWMEILLGVARGDPKAAVHAGPNCFWYVYRRFNRKDRSDGKEQILWQYMSGKMRTIYGVTLPPMREEWLTRR